MDACSSREHHALVRVLPHIKRLDDCVGQFLVRVICDCGAVREIEPEALARLVGWSVTLKELALRTRCSRCGNKAEEIVAVARPRPRGCRKIRSDQQCVYCMAQGERMPKLSIRRLWTSAHRGLRQRAKRA